MSPNKYKTHWYSREESNTVGKDYPKTNMETNELKGFLFKPELTRTSDNMSSLFSKHYAMEIVIQSTEERFPNCVSQRNVPKDLSKEGKNASCYSLCQRFPMHISMLKAWQNIPHNMGLIKNFPTQMWNIHLLPLQYFLLIFNRTSVTWNISWEMLVIGMGMACLTAHRRSLGNRSKRKGSVIFSLKQTSPWSRRWHKMCWDYSLYLP